MSVGFCNDNAPYEVGLIFKCMQFSNVAFDWVYFLLLVVSIRRRLAGYCPWLVEGIIRLMAWASDEIEASIELFISNVTTVKPLI